MATPNLQGAPVVVVAAGGIPVINVDNGTPMTVGANLKGQAVTIVTAYGIPVKLLDDAGDAYVP